MNQYLDDVYTVTSALFGPESGIPWWAWMLVLAAFMWKLMVPEPKTVEDRDEMMLNELLADAGGKKGKKKKK